MEAKESRLPTRRAPKGRSPSSPLADFLRTDQDAIIAAWKARIRQMAPARDLSDAALIDHLPMILDHVADRIDETGPTSANAGPVHHAVDLLAHGFDLDRVVNEYAVLRQSIFDRWERAQNGTLHLGDLRRLDEVIDQALIESSARYAAARERVLKALDRITEAALGNADLDSFLHQLLVATVQAMPVVDAVSVLLREGEVLRVRATHGLDDVDPGTPIPIGEGFAGRIAAEKRPRFARGGALDPHVIGHGDRKDTIRALYGVPLVSGGTVIGVAEMGSRSAYEFSEDDKLLFRTMASRATLVVENAILAMRDRAMHATARALYDSTTFDEAFDKLLPELATHLGWDVGCSWRVDRSGRFLALDKLWKAPGVEVPRFEEASRSILLPQGRGLPGRAWERGAVLHVLSLGDDPRGPRRAIAIGEDLSSAIAFPVTVRDRVVGVVELLSKARRWASEEGVYLTHLVAQQLEQFMRRISAQEALAEERARLQAVIEQMPAGVIVADAPEGRIVLGNRAVEHIWRRPMIRSENVRSYGAWVGYDLETGRRIPWHEWALARAIQRGETVVDQEAEIARGDGTRGVIRVMAAPIRDPGGRLIGGVAVILDITDEKDAIRERERLLDEVRRAVRVREDVLGIVSHDLRNPLNAITLSASILLMHIPEDESGAKMRAQVAMIQRACARMERMIGDLLDMASIRAGRLSIDARPTDLVELLREAVQTHEPLAEQAGLRLVEKVDCERLSVCCDRERVIQALSNILGNAIKVCETSDAITLALEERDGEAVVSVTDTGPGIPSSELERLFEPYWSATRMGKTGTGLGLFITRGIVEAHHGRVWVESHVGDGTTFSFTLPLASNARKSA